MSNQENRIKVIVNDLANKNYLILTYSNKGLEFDGKIISIESIDQVNISLCCSKGEDGRYYFIYNLYFVFLDIITNNGTYLFQLMNNGEVNGLFKYLLASNVKINDPLELIEIYNKITNSMQLYSYFNKHFNEWRKKYNLEIKNFYFSIIENDYMKPLENLDSKDVPNFREQMKQVFNGYINIFNNIKHKK